MYLLQVVFCIFFITITMVGGIKLHNQITNSFYIAPTYFRAITKGLHISKSHKKRAFSKNALFLASVKISYNKKKGHTIKVKNTTSEIEL